MTVHPALTPTQIRTGYRGPGSPRRTAEPATPRTRLASEDDEGTATAEWLAHIRTGRIKVR